MFDTAEYRRRLTLISLRSRLEVAIDYAASEQAQGINAMLPPIAQERAKARIDAFREVLAMMNEGGL